jgi:hypothetical protein
MRLRRRSSSASASSSIVAAARAAASPSNRRLASISSKAPISKSYAWDAEAVAGLDHAQHLQRDQRLAQRRAADAERLGQLTLGRQPLAHLVLAGLDLGGDGIGEATVEFASGHGLLT